MSNANLYHLLRDRCAARADATCLRVPGGPRYSYGALDRWSARMATALTRLGARPGDRVVVQVEKCPAAVALYLACLRGGFVLVPLNTAYTAAELAYFIGDAMPSVVVCDGERQAELAPLLPLRASLLALAGSGGLQQRAAAAEPCGDICDVGEGELAAILYTSGTTGRSKGAMLSHGNLASNALALHRTWGFQTGDTLLHALPIFHVHGLFIALNTAMLNVSEIIFLEKFDTAAVLEALPSATVMMGVPTFYTRLLADPAFGPVHFSHMRLFISGSAPLTAQTFARFESRTGHRILERYGMTETGIISSNPLRGERVAGSVGFALPGTELRICDERGEPAACGEVGSVEVRGANVFRGYWNAPQKSAAEFRPDGWFVTGDLGHLDRERRLTLVGRARDLIISGGLNVYPKEVELCLDGTAEITESAVIGVPHPDLGEAVVAICVASHSPAPTQSQVLEAVAGQLAPFKCPKAVRYVEALPRNAMGKVQKNTLRERYARIFS